MNIYIQPKKKAKIIGRKSVYIKDVADVFTNDINVTDIENIIITNLTSDEEKGYLIPSLDIVKSIANKHKNATVSNIGESDVLLFYRKKENKKYDLWSIIKVVFICLILFIGAATTIMCFHNDSNVESILENFYYIIFGEYVGKPPIIMIPYSIGLFIGVVTFFGHFLSFRVTKDPTPIEIQLTTYDGEMITNIKETLENKKEENKD